MWAHRSLFSLKFLLPNVWVEYSGISVIFWTEKKIILICKVNHWHTHKKKIHKYCRYIYNKKCFHNRKMYFLRFIQISNICISFIFDFSLEVVSVASCFCAVTINSDSQSMSTWSKNYDPRVNLYKQEPKRWLCAYQ